MSTFTVDGAGKPLSGSSPIKGTLTPADLSDAYRLLGNTQSFGTVAIVDAYDDPTAERDVNAYRKFYGLPQCTSQNACFRKVNQNGQASPLPPSAKNKNLRDQWDAEISLDLDMVSAACPKCSLLLLEADDAKVGNLYKAVDTAASLGAVAISASWGTDEYSGETSQEQHFNHLGVEITAAAGDDGYGVLYPATSQYVTSVGGTVLRSDSATDRGWNEVVWSKGFLGLFQPNAKGSGCSAYIAKPNWQTDSACARRTDNDVAAVAQGLSVYDSQQSNKKPWISLNGTSASSPIIAAVYALGG
ncbi:MAG TPA: S8 family serine peptidase, partial [Gemmatimonadales bacterium]|nr:S8 family serine peptidase [Gemmatimonadales bacterium]